VDWPHIGSLAEIPLRKVYLADNKDRQSLPDNHFQFLQWAHSDNHQSHSDHHCHFLGNGAFSSVLREENFPLYFDQTLYAALKRLEQLF
jgi:hypothetical protein